MRKEGPPPANNVSKISLCFETKPLVATLLALTLVMVIWNLQPYYDTILSSSTTRPCSSSPSPPLTTTSLPLTTTTTSLAQTNNYKKLNSPNPSKANNAHLDPNKRLFSAYGNAAALFIQMGAYRGGPQTFAVVGLASKPIHVYGHPWYKCKWISNNGTATRAKSYKILPDWGYGRLYTVVVVNCTFDSNPNQDNSGGKLALYAYYGESQKRYEKVIALEEAPGSYDESKYRPPYEYDYLYCGSSLFGNLSADRMREWMAYHAWFFGERSHFVFHDAGGVSAEVKAVLEPWERAGKVTIQDIKDQEEYDGYYHNQFLAVNDCLHRYRFAANWTFFFDVDEYIYLPDGNTLESVLEEFGINNTQFTIDQYPMSNMLCLNDSTQDYTREWGFEKLLFKDSRTNIWRDRKYAIQAKNAYATGVHMSENVIGGTLHQTETKIRFYHYHNSINVQEELCRQLLPMTAKDKTTWFNNITYVYDDSMKKLAPTIKEFERSFSVL